MSSDRRHEAIHVAPDYDRRRGERREQHELRAIIDYCRGVTGMVERITEMARGESNHVNPLRPEYRVVDEPKLDGGERC